MSHEGAVRTEDVRVALAVQVLGVALNAVAAVHLRQRRRHVGGRAEEVGVGEHAGELHPLLVPVSPQDALNLQKQKRNFSRGSTNLNVLRRKPR